MQPADRAGPKGLRWQSQAVLLVFLPAIATWAFLAAARAWQAHNPTAWQAAAISAGFALLVFGLRAATAGAALTGGILTAAFWLQTPGLHTALWPLLALVALTFAATRFGRRRKEALGTAEGKHGRSAAQVAANLGMAGLAGVGFAYAGANLPVARAALAALIAAMAEATADTLSSELGQVLGGEPRLLTTLRRVPAGTDGAISLAGTLAGCVGAAVVTAVGSAALLLRGTEAMVALAAAIAGLFFDSLLGAVPERAGWLNNDAVNALSTVAAAALAFAVCLHLH